MYKQFFFKLLLLIYCTASFGQTVGKVSAVTVISSSLIRPETQRDSISIFYFSDFTIYKISKPIYFSEFSLSMNNEFFETSHGMNQNTSFFAYDIQHDQFFSFNDDSIAKKAMNKCDFFENYFVKLTLDSASLLKKGKPIIIDPSPQYKHIQVFLTKVDSLSNNNDSLILYYGKNFNGIAHNLIEVFGHWEECKLEKYRIIHHVPSGFDSKDLVKNRVIEYFVEFSRPSTFDVESARRYYMKLANWIKMKSSKSP